MTVASEEARDPVRDVPRAIIGSLIVGAVLFTAVTAVAVGVVAWDKIDPDAGMLDAVKHAGSNPLLFGLVLAGTVTGTFASMLTSLLGQIRIFYVMSRDRLLPRAFGSVNARTRTPIATTLITGSIVAAVAAVVPLTSLLKLVNIGTFSAFVIVCAGVHGAALHAPATRRGRSASRSGRSFVPLAGIALCAWLTLEGLDGADVAAVRDLVRRGHRGLRGVRLPQLAAAPARVNDTLPASASGAAPHLRRVLALRDLIVVAAASMGPAFSLATTMARDDLRGRALDVARARDRRRADGDDRAGLPPPGRTHARRGLVVRLDPRRRSGPQRARTARGCCSSRTCSPCSRRRCRRERTRSTWSRRRSREQPVAVALVACAWIAGSALLLWYGLRPTALLALVLLIAELVVLAGAAGARGDAPATRTPSRSPARRSRGAASRPRS